MLPLSEMIDAASEINLNMFQHKPPKGVTLNWQYDK
jgi:hypothetical protein